MIATPTWWWELLEVLGASDKQKLAGKIRASFKLPQQMSEIHDIENYYLAPQPLDVSGRRHSYCLHTTCSPAGILERGNPRRP